MKFLVRVWVWVHDHCDGEHDSGPAVNRHGKEQKLRASDLHLICRLEAERLGVRGAEVRKNGGREERGGLC